MVFALLNTTRFSFASCISLWVFLLLLHLLSRKDALGSGRRGRVNVWLDPLVGRSLLNRPALTSSSAFVYSFLVFYADACILGFRGSGKNELNGKLQPFLLACVCYCDV